ncbi:N-ethylammeline chlorohydrolase [Rhodococcus opacus]|uniref:N-ethylammeline chlorohydrolase n=2 Tax=Rhodococcus opacus TaxID=37919 RepID=A0A076EJU2_RHOOP|nr:N-ethylammeline chlorohydrolase [Rhodococcus opacus]
MTAAHVLAHRDGDHVLVSDGEIVYRGARILHAGRGWDGPVDETIDCGDALIMPGFIDLDALADIDHALLDSWATPELALGQQWSADYFRSGRRDVFDAPERAVIREYALAQLLRHGVTTFMPIASEAHSSWAETCDDMVEVARIAERLGIRGYLGPAYRSGVNVVDDRRRSVLFDEERGRAGLRDAERFLDYAADHGGDLVHGALLPCRIETLTRELMAATARLAVARDTVVRLHCMQGEVELALLDEWYGMRPVELLEASGLLETRLLVPHGIHLGAPGGGRGRQADLRRLAEADVTIVHCPMTSIRYGAVLESYDSYRTAGVHIALGTDSFPPDLVRGIDYGTNLAKRADGSLAAGATADYIRSATIGGARALGRPDLGRLQPGASADFIVVDLADFAMGVRDDPLRTLTMNGTARDVRRTVVAGRTVMADGVVLGADQSRLQAHAQGLFERMRAAYGERDHRRRLPAELFPPTFPDITKTTTPKRYSHDQS